MSKVSIDREDALELIKRTEQFFDDSLTIGQVEELIGKLQSILFEALR